MNYKQMKFICDCNKIDSKIIPSSSLYDTDEYPVCCDKPMSLLHLSTGHQSAYVMGDIQPYRSPIDKAIIGSRSQHRAHMLRHGVIEAGNEDMSKHIKPPEYRKGDLRERLKYEIGKRHG